MKDEIKRKIKGYVYNEDDEKKILDYITNLQEENEILEINNKTLHEISVSLDSQLSDRSKQLQDYKTRNEKAIDKMKGIKYDLDIEPWSIYQVKGNVLFDLLEILQGEQNE